MKKYLIMLSHYLIIQEIILIGPYIDFHIYICKVIFYLFIYFFVWSLNVSLYTRYGTFMLLDKCIIVKKKKYNLPKKWKSMQTNIIYISYMNY
jgi:hypothetical protein